VFYIRTLQCASVHSTGFSYPGYGVVKHFT